MYEANLWLFFLLVLGVIALPGLDMAVVLGNALAGGRTHGLATLAGVVAGGACHVLMAAVGISVLVRWVPGAFNGLLIAGAVYLAWIGWSLVRSEGGFGLQAPARRRTHATNFRQGLVTCLLNPKAYLFMLALFPRFLDPGHGSMWPQMVSMWVIIAATQTCVYGSVALAADGAGRWLENKPRANMLAMRCVGACLIAAAALTGFESWRGM
jgi:threonine/homoserine/homoserine lactone efflux protein